MDKVEICEWPGTGGNKYPFEVYPIDSKFPDREGNYIFCRREGNKYYAAYIGEGLLSERIAFRLNENDSRIKCCDYVCIKTEANRDLRKQIEADLLAGNPEAYEPTGCNVRIGG